MTHLHPYMKVRLNPARREQGDDIYGIGVVRRWIKPQPEPDADNGYWSIDFERYDSYHAENLWLQVEDVVPVPLEDLQFPKRQWISHIQINPGINHLTFWTNLFLDAIDEDNLATFSVQPNLNYFSSETGGMYCTGTAMHQDPLHSRRSALLIVHNEGFLVRQSGLTEQQEPGTILVLHPHEPHQLQKIKDCARHWAAVFFDYQEDLTVVQVESELQQAYLRIFQ